VRRPLRIGFLVVLMGAGFACGLDVLGSKAVDPNGDGGSESGTLDGSSGADARDEGSEVDLDGGLDAPALDLDAAQQKCIGVCEAGTCEAGTCRIGCDGTNACLGGVVCPAGVPCDVRCSGTNACFQGVDCKGATACSIACNGVNACGSGGVDCSGSTCAVACTGPANPIQATCAGGVRCDAGRCDLTCVGGSACANSPVICDSNVCNVRCGDGGDDGRQACTGGVQCNARDACNIACASRDTCVNNPVVAHAGKSATVHCGTRGSCRAGVDVAAPDASISCQGMDTCINNTLRCDADGGKCTASCDNTNGDPAFCCAAGSMCSTTTAGCAFTTNGCP